MNSFKIGDHIGVGDLDILLYDSGNVPVDPFWITYTIYDCTTGNKIAKPLVGAPSRAGVGEYFVFLFFMAGQWNIGSHIIEWKYKSTQQSNVVKSIQRFDVVRDVCRQATLDKMPAQKLGSIPNPNDFEWDDSMLAYGIHSKPVWNRTGSSIAAGTMVYIKQDGSMAPAIATALLTSDVVGSLPTTVVNNAQGRFVFNGFSICIKEEGSPEPQSNQQLFLSNTQAGTVTTMSPVTGVITVVGKFFKGGVLVHVERPIELN